MFKISEFSPRFIIIVLYICKLYIQIIHIVEIFSRIYFHDKGNMIEKIHTKIYVSFNRVSRNFVFLQFVNVCFSCILVFFLLILITHLIVIFKNLTINIERY